MHSSSIRTLSTSHKLFFVQWWSGEKIIQYMEDEVMVLRSVLGRKHEDDIESKPNVNNSVRLHTRLHASSLDSATEKINNLLVTNITENNLI